MAKQFETGIQIQAAAEKHGEKVEQLDQTVSEYGEAIERFREDQASTQDVEEAIDEMLNCFHGLFETQNWLGEITGQITNQEVQEEYEKFTAYRGLVCAADQIERDQENSVAGPRIPTGTGVLRKESEALIDAWGDMLQAYEAAVRYEDDVQQISLEEGREQEGLDPYAFETPFQALENEYQRIQDLNQCVNTGYR
jgi:hypothetical protein